MENSITDISIIFAYKKEAIMEAVESVCFIENADYESTNASKSLLMALENVNEDCLWLK